MNEIDTLLDNNRSYAAGLTHGHVDVHPRRKLAIVTCMDSRLDVFAALGLGHGEAHVLRNAGGILTDDVIRSLAISQRLLGTREIMLIHHTDCGLEKVTEDDFARQIELESGSAPSFIIGAFRDAAEDVAESLVRVRGSRYILHRDAVRGFLYDVDTHALREIHAAD